MRGGILRKVLTVVIWLERLYFELGVVYGRWPLTRGGCTWRFYFMIFFSGSCKLLSLANVLVVTGVVSIGFLLPALRIFSAPFSSAKVCSRSVFCPRVRSNVAMWSEWTTFKASWESRSLFPSLSIVFCFSPWLLHLVLKSKLVIKKKIELLLYVC